MRTQSGGVLRPSASAPVVRRRRCRRLLTDTLNRGGDPHPTDFDLVQRYAEAGVDQVIVMVIAFDPDSLLAGLDAFATGLVVPASRL